MKRLLVSLIFVNYLHPSSAETCQDGRVSFMLTTNAKLDASVFLSRESITLTSCANLCRQQPKCQSLTFHRNLTDSLCTLSEETTEGGRKNRVVYQKSFSPSSSLYYMEKMCLKGACDRLFVFEWMRGMVLEGHNTKILAGVNQLSCLTACVQETKFRCRSAEYDELTRECHLSRYDRFNRNSMFKSTKASAHYYDNTCGYDAVISSATTEILLLGNVDHPYSLIEHRDVSVSDCGQLCLDNTAFPCRSFLYGQRDDRRYCGLTQQNRNGLLRSPGSFLPTESLSFYEIARNLDSCDTSDLSMEVITGVYLDVQPYKVETNLSPGECTMLCKSEAKCRSMNIDYDSGTCKLLQHRIRVGHEEKLKTSTNYNYFEKSCIFGADKCHGQWVFERVRRKTLIGVQTRLVVRANTKEECQSSCLSTRDFVCRSAEYNYELNECRLSPHNRFSTTDKFVVLEDAKLVVDYFESNCYSEARGFCNLKKIQQRAQILSDDTTQTYSLEQCKKNCFDSQDFICRSFTYDYTSRICQLSHHTRHSVPENRLRPAPTTDYYDITSCFEVSVKCEPDRMVTNVKTNKIFRGRLYAKSRPTTCLVDIAHSTDFTIPVPLIGPQCGTVSESEGKFSNVIVIQTNDRVVTSLDKAVGVHCSYQVGNKTEEATLSLNITDLSSVDTARGAPELPNLSMKIVDVRGKETEAVSLGDVVRVQVLMDDESTYGIFLRNMVARSVSDNSELTLIDNMGCPVEVKMMKEVRRVDGGRKALESYLEAFSFTGSNLLTIETEVETCINNCKPVTCQIPSGRSEDTQSVLSFGRKRKRREVKSGPIISTVTLTKTLSVKSSQFGVDSLYQESPQKPVKEFEPDEFNVEEDSNLVCVEPTVAALVGSLLLFIQAVTFAVCLGLVCKKYLRNRIGRDDSMEKSIYYNN